MKESIGRRELHILSMIYEVWKAIGGKRPCVLWKYLNGMIECEGVLTSALWYSMESILERLRWKVIREVKENRSVIEIEDMEGLVNRAYGSYYGDWLWKFDSEDRKSVESYVELLKRIIRDIKKEKLTSVTLRKIVCYEIDRQREEIVSGEYDRKIERIKSGIEQIKNIDVVVELNKRRFIEKIERVKKSNERELKGLK